ncbi:MAG: LamG domain-containing protein [Oligoflexia bacterium]|nr:LamG domain-containing protein [Oligoflexia bacterium]
MQSLRSLQLLLLNIVILFLLCGCLSQNLGPKLNSQTSTSSGTGKGSTVTLVANVNSYDFGYVPVSSTSDDFRLKLNNYITRDAIGCTAPTITGTDAADFVISSNGCGITIKAKSFCYIYLKSSPKTSGCLNVSGVRSATFNFSCSNLEQNISIPISVTAQDICSLQINGGALRANSTLNLSYLSEGTNTTMCFGESTVQSLCSQSSSSSTSATYALAVTPDSETGRDVTIYGWSKYSYDQKILNGRLVSSSIYFDNRKPRATDFSCSTPAVCPTITNTPEITVKFVSDEELLLSSLNSSQHIQVVATSVAYSTSWFTPVAVATSASSYTYLATVYLTPTPGSSDGYVSIAMAAPTSITDLASNSLSYYTPTPFAFIYDNKEPTPVFSATPRYTTKDPSSSDKYNFRVYLNFNEGVSGVSSNNFIAPTGTVTISGVTPNAEPTLYPTSFIIDGYINPTGVADYSDFVVQFVPTAAPVTDRAGNIVTSTLSKTLGIVWAMPTVSISYTPDNSLPAAHGSPHISSSSFYIYASFLRGSGAGTPEPIATSYFTPNPLTYIQYTPAAASLTFNSVTPVATGVYGISTTVGGDPAGTPITIVFPAGWAHDFAGNNSTSQSLTIKYYTDPVVTNATTNSLFPITGSNDPKTSESLITINPITVSNSDLRSIECYYENKSVQSTDANYADSYSSCADLDSMIEVDSSSGNYIIGKTYFSTYDLANKSAVWNWRPTINQRGTYKITFRAYDVNGHPVQTPTPVSSSFFITVRDNLSSGNMLSYTDSYFALATPTGAGGSKDMSADGSKNTASTSLVDLKADSTLVSSGYGGGGITASYMTPVAGIDLQGSYTDLQATFSAGVWFKAPTAGTARCILANKNYSEDDGNGWYLGVNSSNKLIVNVANGVGRYSITDNNAMTENYWYFIFFTWNKTTPTLKIFKNGVEITNISSTLTIAANQDIDADDNIFLGKCIDGNLFSGAINSSVIYSNESSASTISDNFLSTVNRFRSFKPKQAINTSNISSNLIYHYDAFFALDGVQPQPTSSNGTCRISSIYNLAFAPVTSTSTPAPASANCDIDGQHGSGLSGTPGTSPNPFRYHLDGIDDQIVLIGLHPTPGFERAMTIGAWVRPTEAPAAGTAMVIFQRGDTANLGVSLEINEDADFEFRMNTNESTEVVATCATTIQSYKWYNVVAVKNMSKIKLYLNGDFCSEVAAVDATIAFGTPTALDFIGGNPSGTPEFFNGDISSLVLYNTPLSSQQIKQNFYATADRFREVNLEKTSTLGLILHLDAANAKNKLLPGSGAAPVLTSFSDLSAWNYKDTNTNMSNRADPAISVASFAGNSTVGSSFYKLNFANNSDYVNILPTGIDGTPEGTYVLWYKGSAAVSICNLVSRVSIDPGGGAEGGAFMQLNEFNKLRMQLNKSDGTPVYTAVASVEQTPNDWQHLAFIFNKNISGSKNRIFLNGQEVASAGYATSAWDYSGAGAGTDTYSIGNSGLSVDNGCTGDIGIFKAYNRALHPKEIEQMCKAEKWRYNTNICQ